MHINLSHHNGMKMILRIHPRLGLGRDLDGERPPALNDP
jgi:hypothetical protein